MGNKNARSKIRWLSSLFLVVVLYLSWPYFDPRLSAPYGLLVLGAGSLLAGDLLAARNTRASKCLLITAPIFGVIGVAWLCFLAFI